MALMVGLTGGMGSGKSTVADMFRQLGASIIDADEICRILVEPDQPAWQEIVKSFGKDILLKDRTLDRAQLADIIFNDPNQKKNLEVILHPKVFDEELSLFEKIVKKNPHALVIIDAALLIESGNYRKVDKVVVVSSDEETQTQRILDRSRFSRDDIRRRIQSQMDLNEKIKFADYVLENNAGLAELKNQVESLYKDLQSLAD